MSINLEINKKLLESDINNIKIHYIPASTDGNGPCNVETMFENYTNEENGQKINALRGYPLIGNTFDLPENFVGVVFDEKTKSLDENSERIWKSAGTFNQFFNWNYDKIPSKEDSLQKALDIIGLSQSMCDKITDEMLVEQTKEYETRLKELSDEKTKDKKANKSDSE